NFKGFTHMACDTGEIQGISGENSQLGSSGFGSFQCGEKIASVVLYYSDFGPSSGKSPVRYSCSNNGGYIRPGHALLALLERRYEEITVTGVTIIEAPGISAERLKEEQSVALIDVGLITDDNAGTKGTVSISPESVGGNYYRWTDEVTITATPDSGSDFIGWTGADADRCGVSPVCTFVPGIVDNLSIQAQFKIKPILTAIASGGESSINISPQGEACSNTTLTNCFVYSTGNIVTLTPVAGPGRVFSGWGGDIDCKDGSVTMSEHLTCRANFKRTNYELNIDQSAGTEITSNPDGDINCGTENNCSKTYQVSDGEKTVTLNATIDPGWAFVRWSGVFDCWDEDEGDNDPLSARVKVGSKDVNCSVIAVPEGTEYALTVEKIGGGSVTAVADDTSLDSSGIDCSLNACSQNYLVNNQVTLTAKASKGSEFIGFSIPERDRDRFYNPNNHACTDGKVFMDDNLNCVASFRSKVLVVKGTNSNESKEQNPLIGVLRNQDLVDYDIWDVKNPNQGDNSEESVNVKRVEPVLEDLQKYGRVIWYTGDTYDGKDSFSPAAGPSPAAEGALAEYLDGGGCLMMSSPNYYKDRGLTPFMQNYLGVSAVTEDAVETHVKGTGDVYLGFSELTTGFGGGSNVGFFGIKDRVSDPDISDVLTLNPNVPGSNTLFTYRAGEGTAAVAVDNGIFRSAFLGFPFEDLPSGNAQNNTMRAFLDFCGQTESDDPLEVNDDFETAAEQQGAVSLEALKILQQNEDYFKWISLWSADASIGISFQHETGDLTLEVYDENQLLIGSSDTQNDNETIVIQDVDAGSTYYIRVYGVDGSVSNVYDLGITQLGLNDIDHDGVPDEDDALPYDPLEQADADADGIGDFADTDDDNDGLPDTYEVLNGLDPLSASDKNRDPDGDGWGNLDEYNFNSDVNVSNSVPLRFIGQTDVELNTQIVSNTITVDGIDDEFSVRVTGTDSSSEYEVNGNGIWLKEASTVARNATIRVRHISSSALSTTIDSYFTMNSISATFSSITSADAIIPFDFSFIGQRDNPVSSLAISEAITVAINKSTPVAISVSGGEYEVNGNGTWLTANGAVRENDTVKVRHTTSSSTSTSVDTVLSIDGVSATFSSLTTSSPVTRIVTRAEISQAILQSIEGLGFTGPTGSVYSDVVATDFNASWIEKLESEGITEGCATNQFCPNMVVTKEQLAKILLKAKHGSTYTPDAATGVFADVSSTDAYAGWIEELFKQGITEGCDANNYCPNELVNLATFTKMLDKTFQAPVIEP
ncbi:MAG: hypothetical protein V7784_23440, partial [Oceanospirillaceae bacterium]